ncbi:unnamed protein product [Rangifer tarandus platyrhynchus]|uniref:Uncharacterized protein n=1 Tax=Rangifer tarandus platyrhynchus TaxID=3082113 RepID=A0AC59YHT5_RANTA
MCLLRQFTYKSSVMGPRRGPPSCNWWGFFFAETDILTTRGTQRPACLPMDQTQRPQLGPFCPWSPPDADNWPECPTGCEVANLDPGQTDSPSRSPPDLRFPRSLNHKGGRALLCPRLGHSPRKSSRLGNDRQQRSRGTNGRSTH